MTRAWLGFVALAAAVAATPESPPREDTMKTLDVTSTAFQQGERIPDEFTCSGADRSPPLAWEGAPDGTRSFALIADDPDAPRGTWVHWVLWGVPGDSTGLARGDDTGTSGTSSFGRTGYGGPCPPRGHGTHRYFFKVYALDTTLDLPPSTDKQGLEAAMAGHVLAEGQVMGTYSRG